MASTDSKINRFACVLAFLCLSAVVCEIEVIGGFRHFLGHVHQAFWCASIELAVLGPIHAITYLSERRLAPRIFERLSSFVINPFLAEATFSSIVWWVKLFVVRGSSAPLPADTSKSLDLLALDVNGSLYQAFMFLCVIQIVHDINHVLRRIQEEKPDTDNALADIEPLFDGSEYFWDAILDRFIYVYLAGQTLLYSFMVHMFTNMFMYLQRMAVGSWVTGFVNAYNTLPAGLFCIYAAFSIFILATIIIYVLGIHNEDLAEEAESRQREVGRKQDLVRRLRKELAVDLIEGDAHQEEDEARLRRYLSQVLRTAYNNALAKKGEFRRQLGKVHEVLHQLRRISEVLRTLDDHGFVEEEVGRQIEALHVVLHQLSRIRQMFRTFDDEDFVEVEVRQQLKEVHAALLQLEQLVVGQPPPRARRQRASLHDSIVREMMNRVQVWSLAGVIRGIELLVPLPHYVHSIPALEPEFAALWSEDERADFYTDLLTRGPAFSALGAALVEQGALQPGDYEDLWRRAELTRAVGISVGGMMPAIMSALCRMACALVCMLEWALGVCVVVCGIFVIYFKWSHRTRGRERGGEARA